MFHSLVFSSRWSEGCKTADSTSDNTRPDHSDDVNGTSSKARDADKKPDATSASAKDEENPIENMDVETSATDQVTFPQHAMPPRITNNCASSGKTTSQSDSHRVGPDSRDVVTILDATFDELQALVFWVKRLKILNNNTSSTVLTTFFQSVHEDDPFYKQEATQCFDQGGQTVRERPHLEHITLVARRYGAM